MAAETEPVQEELPWEDEPVSVPPVTENPRPIQKAEQKAEQIELPKCVYAMTMTAFCYTYYNAV